MDSLNESLSGEPSNADPSFLWWLFWSLNLALSSALIIRLTWAIPEYDTSKN